MKKKILCGLLAAIMLLMAIPVFADTNLPSWSSFPQLSYGSSGDIVRIVRVITKYYNPSSISVTTSFDTTTKNAVKKFQKNYGFSSSAQDGIVGPNTWTAMHSVLGGKTRITGSGTGNGSASSSGGYYGYKVYQKSSATYTSLYYFRTDVNHPEWLDVYVAAAGTAPGTWYWAHPSQRP